MYKAELMFDWDCIEVPFAPSVHQGWEEFDTAEFKCFGMGFAVPNCTIYEHDINAPLDKYRRGVAVFLSAIDQRMGNCLRPETWTLRLTNDTENFILVDFDNYQRIELPEPGKFLHGFFRLVEDGE